MRVQPKGIIGQCKALETALNNKLLSSHEHLKKHIFSPPCSTSTTRTRHLSQISIVSSCPLTIKWRHLKPEGSVPFLAMGSHMYSFGGWPAFHGVPLITSGKSGLLIRLSLIMLLNVPCLYLTWYTSVWLPTSYLCSITNRTAVVVITWSTNQTFNVLKKHTHNWWYFHLHPCFFT